MWVGDPDAYTPMVNVPEFDQDRVQGGLYPTQIWQQYMNNAHAFLPGDDWAAPPAAARAPQRLYLPGNECIYVITGYNTVVDPNATAPPAAPEQPAGFARPEAPPTTVPPDTTPPAGAACDGAGAGVQPSRVGHDDPAERARPASSDQHRPARLPDRCVLSDDLLELQRIDSAIDQLTYRRANLPERAAAEEASADLARTTRQIAELIARQRELSECHREGRADSAPS